jgi:uncharacterized delta-60 repeat protein
MKKIFTLIITCTFLASAFHVFAQPGTLDSSFGVNGKVITANGANAAIALQTDGKFVVTGTVGGVFSHSYITVKRYNPNGDPDSSFGLNGKVDTYFDTAQNIGSEASSILIQPDGKILVGGDGVHYYYGSYYFALARYLNNGNLDSSFGKNGIALDFIGPFPKENIIRALGLQKNGKIIAAGWSDGYCLVRYTSNGVIDSSFADHGVMRNQDSATYVINDIWLRNDGKIITACASQPNIHRPSADFEVNRLLPSGAYDSGFATNAYAFTDFYGGTDQPFSIVGLKDSSFIVGGYAVDDATSSNYIGLAKYRKNGNVFNSFGLNGKLTIASSSGGNMKLLVQQDDKILVAGTALIRLNVDGTFDSTFGAQGKAIDFEGAEDAVLQTNEKIVTMGGGSLQRFNGDYPIMSIQKNISIAEGNSGYTTARFNILLDRASTSTVKVDYATKDGSAQAGSDYVANSGTFTFKPGKTSKKITINIVGDNTYENNEKFSLVLSNPVNALLGDLDSATCTIKNDDPLSPQAQTNIAAVTNGINIKLYPNPVNDELRVEGLNTSDVTISVTDIHGRELIKTITNNCNHTINVKQLSVGVYYLRIESDKKITMLKFLKQ